MARGFSRGLALTVALGVSGVAHAHEFIVKPGAMAVQAGAELQVADTEGHKDGAAKVKIIQPGIWMARVQHSALEDTEDYDRYVPRAVLPFEVDSRQ